ncbi:MAG TPA: alpha-L-fucosidase [Bacillota bacterium]|nr:alpha-L-fucosidase [Clostridiales bacterium]HPT84378.1 alpha-L-fucosidase [Bacillota bacterium]
MDLDKLTVIKPAPTPGNTEWFVHDRFGMFIHWGLYALPARHEWVKNHERMSNEQYEKYFCHFDPDLYDPELWAKVAADAGMKYFVVTTKHHEGFCLWDSDLTDYKVTNTPYGRDLLGPMVEAFRGRGLKVGFYHSLLDWHHPDYTVDECHPMRDNAEYAAKDKERDFARYREYLFGQTRELLTRFGKIDILWYDFSVGPSHRYPGKGKDEWHSEELIKLVRELQPGILINDRLQIDQDIKTPEQYMPREWVKVNGVPVVWEACHTFSGSWGYHRDEESWKSAEQLIIMLIDAVSKGGNLLLNVGPTGRGEFDERALDRLTEIGKWMRRHSRSIYGCTQAPLEFKAPECTKLTYNPEKKRLYIHVLSWQFNKIYLEGELARHVDYVQLLSDASEIRFNRESDELVSLNIPVKKPLGCIIPVLEVFLK